MNRLKQFDYDDMKVELISYRIGETYIRFDIEYSEANLELLNSLYLDLIEGASVSDAFKVSFEFDEGSLKSRIVIWVSSIFLMVSNYGSFRTGVDMIQNDIRKISDKIIAAVEESPAFEADILRSERRTGIVGRMEELYRKIAHLERKINDYSDNQAQELLNEIKQEVANLYAVLNNEDRNEFLNDLDQKYGTNLPMPNEKRVQYLINRYGLKPDDKVTFIDEEEN